MTTVQQLDGDEWDCTSTIVYLFVVEEELGEAVGEALGEALFDVEGELFAFADSCQRDFVPTFTQVTF